MQVNTNDTQNFATEQESGASGAPDVMSAPRGTYVQTPKMASYWAHMKRGKVHGTLKNVAHLLEGLVTRCHEEGAHKQFRWTLDDPNNQGNDAAVMLIIALALQLSEQHAFARLEHKDKLRLALEAYEAQTDTNPSTN